MVLTIVASLLLALGVTAIPQDKRVTVGDSKIYAYGTGVSGLPILTDSNGTDTFCLSYFPPEGPTAEHNS
jgi:hypothetical protein